MELRPIINIEDQLTGGKFYRIVSHTDTEYFVINNNKVKKGYPKSVFEKPGEVYTYDEAVSYPNLGRITEKVLDEKCDTVKWMETAWGKLSQPIQEESLNPAFKSIMESIDTSLNNGGSTDYYQFKPEWKELMDIIEDRKLSYAQANILKAAFTFNVGRHSGTDEIRDLNKIIYFAQRELDLLKKKKQNG